MVDLESTQVRIGPGNIRIVPKDIHMMRSESVRGNSTKDFRRKRRRYRR